MNLVPRVFQFRLPKSICQRVHQIPLRVAILGRGNDLWSLQFAMGIIRNDNENIQFELELGVFCKIVSSIHLTNYFLFEALVIFGHEQSGEINYSLSIL